MATTETRTGFRLPWSTGHRAADSAPETAAQIDETPGTSLVAEPTAATEARTIDWTPESSPMGDAAPSPHADTVHGAPDAGVADDIAEQATADPDAADREAPRPDAPRPDAPRPDTSPVDATDLVGTTAADDRVPGWTADGGPAPDPITPEAEITETPMLDTPAAPSAPPAWPGAARRPTKFLADLTNAMRATAEAERATILDRFHAEAEAFVERIQERSGAEQEKLRQRAEDDVTGIHDSSESEIARIQRATDERIAARRADLDREIETHAARVERAVDRVRATVDDYETSMSRFFDGLLIEDDPAQFAERASNLPEPPSLEDAVAAADEKSAPLDARAMPDAVLRAPAFAAPQDETEPEMITADADLNAAQHGSASVSSWPFQGGYVDPRSAGMARVEAAETDDQIGAAHAWAPDARDDAAASASDPEGGRPEAESSDAESAPRWAAEPDPAPIPEPEPATTFDTVDPRVAALGLSPDHAAAAETEALRDADGDGSDGPDDEVPALDDETIAARLAGLPQPGGEAMATAATTQVVVSGLVSVASIAGFKRHLGRLHDVRSVGVSSGPDGEFLFTVTHGVAAALHESIPTLPGFAARVTGSGTGVLNVTARDPETGG